MKKGLQRVKDIFWYSDSEPNEIMIALAITFVLPIMIYKDFLIQNWVLGIFGVCSGIFQLYASAWCGCLNKRLVAVQISCVVCVATCFSLFTQGLLGGSKAAWFIILLLSLWNMIRVFHEKINR